MDDDNFPLRFGKYQGKTPKQVLETDPGYVIWLFDETDVEISEDLYDAALDILQSEPDTYAFFNRER